MKIRLTREYTINHTLRYDLVEVYEIYFKKDTELARFYRRYKVAPRGLSTNRLIKVIEKLPEDMKFVFREKFTWEATVNGKHGNIECLSVSPQLNGSSTTVSNGSTKGRRCLPQKK
jgi:hypothetical protein